jgi:hypothetical protein
MKKNICALLIIFLSIVEIADATIVKRAPIAYDRPASADQSVPQNGTLGAAEHREYDAALMISNTDLTTGDVVHFVATAPIPVLNSQAVIEMNEFYGSPGGFEMTRVSDTTFEGRYKVAEKASGRMEVRARLFGEIDGKMETLYSKRVQLYVTPNMDALRGMEVVPNRTRIISVGNSLKIEILGAFDDGYDRFISDSAMGTRYEVAGEEGIVSLSPDGLIMGLKEGTTCIRITNGTLSNDLMVEVTPSFEQKPTYSGAAEHEEYDIALTVSNRDLSTGEAARFTVAVPDAMSDAKAVIKFDNFYGEILWFDMAQVSDTTFEYEYKAEGRTSGRLEAKAMLLGEIDGEEEMLYSQRVQLYVTPKMDDLWGMEVVPYKSINITVGNIEKIAVLGAFDDGYDRFISDSAMGTRYEVVGEEGVVSLSPNGVIKGLKEGTTRIKITNGFLSTDFRVAVFPSSGKSNGPDKPERK